jgi:hypothetical protein
MKRVLVVEDEKDICEILAYNLDQAGHEGEPGERHAHGGTRTSSGYVKSSVRRAPMSKPFAGSAIASPTRPKRSLESSSDPPKATSQPP